VLYHIRSNDELINKNKFQEYYMVHKTINRDHRSFDAGSPAPKMTTEEIIEFLGDENFSGYDMAFLRGVVTEMRTYFEKMTPLRGSPKVSIFGSARTQPDHPDYITCSNFAKLMADKFGYHVITGAGPGIMEAGSKGAGLEKAIGLNISLPFEQDANPFIEDDQLITFYYFLIRKLAFVREADAIVLCPGGFGTLDEGFEALTLIQTGRAVPVPVVCLEHENGTFWEKVMTMVHGLREEGTISRPDIDMMYMAKTPEAAADYINDFYYRFHSLRYLQNGRAVIRLNRDMPEELLVELQETYKELFKGAADVQMHDRGLDEEQDEPDLMGLKRLSFDIDHTKPVALYFFIRDLNRKLDGEVSAESADDAHVNPRPTRMKAPSAKRTK
jgi:uncharacterized protein (TIGR00730 family)